MNDDLVNLTIVEDGEETRPGRPEKKPKARETSFISDDRFLYEQIVTDGVSSFLRYDSESGEIVTVSEAAISGETLLPITGEEIGLGAIILPSNAAEFGDTKSLLAEIEEHISHYLDLSASFRKFASYYILLTWLYDRMTTLPYLRALGDTGCGKSRFLDVIGRLCYKPILVSGCVTPAPIYRLIKRWAGTMILDEADLKSSDEYSEVVTILNCGFERDRPVIRATKDNPDKIQFLPTFGPKVFATRRKFKDAALEARCLTEIMQETQRSDIPAILARAFYEEQKKLRTKLLLYRFRNWSVTDSEQALTLDLSEIEPRLRQIGSAFGAVFANQTEVLEDFKAFIKEHQRELIEQRAFTPIGQVVETLFSLIESDALDTLDTLDTVSGIQLLPIGSKDIADILGFSPQSVGLILKTLGLETKLKRQASGNKRCIVFDKQKLETLKRRYIVTEDSDRDVSTASNVSTVSGDSPEVTTVTDTGDNPMSHYRQEEMI